MIADTTPVAKRKLTSKNKKTVNKAATNTAISVPGSSNTNAPSQAGIQVQLHQMQDAFIQQNRYIAQQTQFIREILTAETAEAYNQLHLPTLMPPMPLDFEWCANSDISRSTNGNTNGNSNGDSKGDSRGDDVYSPNGHDGADDIPDAAVDLTNADDNDQEVDNVGQRINYLRANASFHQK